jgi:hypothetical protein
VSLAPQAPPPFPRTSPLAIGSLVAGILGATCVIPFAGIGAIVCGHMALAAMKREGPMLTGRGLAIAGLITGYLSTAFTLIFAAIFALEFAAFGVVGKYAIDMLNAGFDCKGIAQAVREYHDAYGSFPPGADAKEGEDLTYPEDNKLLFDSLCAVDGAKTKGNPKGTVFFKPSDPIPFAKKSHFDSTGKFLDGWGHPFRVRVDANGDGKIANPFKTGAGPASIEEKAIAWSMGPTTFPGRNGETDGTGRVCSWENPDTQKKPTTPKPNDDHEPLENEK